MPMLKTDRNSGFIEKKLAANDYAAGY